MAIEELIAVIPPPSRPVCAVPTDSCRQVEQALGMSLPDDLFAIAKTYGSGAFIDGEIGFLNPFDSDYTTGIERNAINSRCFKDWFPDYPFASYPDVPGLLAWGHDSNGHSLFYLTEGDPSDWPVVLVPHEYEDRFDRWEMPLTTFLAKAFSNEIRSTVWTDSLDELNRNFLPQTA